MAIKIQWDWCYAKGVKIKSSNSSFVGIAS